ncbi:hypothetical protein ACS127_17810 [Amphibacillus sp. Q70]|uniref:hypothetical protein n=1 Tax=Amphibacillus sp. Q70 TaxID=3453416 RepID=UPI003F855B7A
MVIVTKVIAIGIIIISFIIGFVFFYIFGDFLKEEKKKYIEALISQLLNFIIFIWIGKILLNFSLFVQDPLAVLAYPSDSKAFYLAVLFTAITVIYHLKHKNLETLKFFEAFTHIFLLSLFFYEFFQVILGNDLYAIGYLIVLVILLITFFLLRSYLSIYLFLKIVLTGWTIGMLGLSFIYPFVSVFGYLIERWFILMFFTGCLSVLIINERKRKA